MKLKKLLFVGAYPPPYGGIASHLYDLLPLLNKQGYEVVLLTWDQQVGTIQQSPGLKRIFLTTKDYFVKNRLKVLFTFFRSLRHKKEMNWKDFLRVVTQGKAINELVNNERIDGVFFYDNYNGFVIPILKQYNRTTPLVLMIFGDFYLYPEKYTSISRFMFNVFIKTDMILSSSSYCAASISSLLGYTFPVRVIYVGVDHEEYSQKEGKQLRDQFEIPSSAIVFSFLGRMNKSMGLDFLLKIAPKLLDIGEDVYLLIAGAKGDLSYEVEELAKNHLRIKFSTDIPFEKKSDFYAACDVFLAPTMEKHACMGVSIKEAMACGKPIIASNSGGIPEAIEDGVNGFLVPFTEGQLDETIFIERAKRLVSDSLLRKNMGTAGRQKVMRLFTNDETTRRYLEIIKTLEQGAVSSRL